MSPLKSTFGAASAFGWIPRATVNPSLTSVEFTLWSGGSNTNTPAPGGSALKRTGLTFAGTPTYTIAVGAANEPSSFYNSIGTISETISPSASQSKNVVNGIETVYTSGSGSIQTTAGWYWSNSYGSNVYVNDILTIGHGKMGAGGNGKTASWNDPMQYYSGGGGDGFLATGNNLVNFPYYVGQGGAGSWSPSAYQAYVQNYYQYIWVNGNPGSSALAANTGVGSQQGSAAGSGGFSMRYSNTQLPLASTTGTVVYLNSGGYHNYFWKSTGSFTV